MVLSSQREAQSVLRNRAKLKGHNIFIERDLTPSERQLVEAAKDELKRRLDNGETDLHLKYFRGVPKVVAKN